jgi:hypothetical protein
MGTIFDSAAAFIEFNAFSICWSASRTNLVLTCANSKPEFEELLDTLLALTLAAVAGKLVTIKPASTKFDSKKVRNTFFIIMKNPVFLGIKS